MSKITLSFFFVALLVCASCQCVWGSDPDSKTGTGLQASYYKDAGWNILGLTRIDPEVNFSWNSVPAVGIPADNFSVLWKGTLEVPVTGTYTITVNADDTAEIWIGSELVIFQPSYTATKTGTVNLIGGSFVPLSFRMRDTGGPAKAQLLWSYSGQETPIIIPKEYLYPTGAGDISLGAGTGLLATYYSNEQFTGAHSTVMDPQVCHYWANSEPMAGIGADRWAAIWKGEIEAPQTDTYTLTAISSGGVMVLVDDRPVIIDLIRHDLSVKSGAIPLTADKRSKIKIQYYQGAKNAELRLLWASASLPVQLIPMDRLYPSAIDETQLTIRQGELSRVSPAWVSGTINSVDKFVSASWNGADATLIRKNENEWYIAGSNAGVPLDPLAPGKLEIKTATQVRAETITWLQTDVSNTYGLDPLAIRRGDSLLFVDSSATGVFELDTAFDGKSFKSTKSGTNQPGIQVQFQSAGTFTIQSRIGGQLSGKITVKVVGVNFNGPVACELTYTRIKDIDVNLIENVIFTANDNGLVSVSVKSSTSNTGRLNITPLSSGSPHIEAHLLDPNGPLIADQEIDEFMLRTSAEKRIAVDQIYPDGSTRGVATLYMTPGISNLDIVLNAFVAGVYFDSGSSILQVNTNDFTINSYLKDGTIWYKYGVIRGANVPHGFCHSFVAYQNSVQISF